jgi:hypothetical protein
MDNRQKQINDILFNLGVIWSRIPQQRFFQLLFNYTRLGTRTHLGSVKDPFHYDDGELEEHLKKLTKAILEDENNVETKIQKRN